MFKFDSVVVTVLEQGENHLWVSGSCYFHEDGVRKVLNVSDFVEVTSEDPVMLGNVGTAFNHFIGKAVTDLMHGRAKQA